MTYWQDVIVKQPRGHFETGWFGRNTYIPPSPERLLEAQLVSERLAELQNSGCQMKMNESWDVAIRLGDTETMVTQVLLGSRSFNPVPRILTLRESNHNPKLGGETP